jgi:NADH dehydrogenase
MLLLTGATGSVGFRLLPLLLEREDVRCLVREPRRLGERRVDVQIALGDLGEMSDPYLVRQALRGVDTVIHLAATIRDQPHHRIEELNGLATVRLLRAAERSGVRRFVFFSALNAAAAQRTRLFRAKWLAERAVASSPLETMVFAPSIVYDRSDPWVTLLRRFSFLPVMPVSGGGQARFQPIWADDVARCVVAALDRSAGGGGHGEGGGGKGGGGRGDGKGGGEGDGARWELAGPETLTYDEMSDLVSRAAGRPRPLVHLPLPMVRAGLLGLRSIFGESVFATWEEAELMEISMTSDRGTADVEALGITPRMMEDVLAEG